MAKMNTNLQRYFCLRQFRAYGISTQRFNARRYIIHMVF